MGSASGVGAGRTALITGASSGIGHALAAVFARHGFRLVLVARDPERLQRVATELSATHQIHAAAISQDLARPHAAQSLTERLRREGVEVDVLVNNAGFAVYGPFAETDLATELEMAQVNVVTLTELAKLLLPGMLRRGWGRILNVASTAAFQPGPLMAVYYATKAYVLSFSEALANELRGSGVSVTALCPGMTRSGFQQRAGLRPSYLLKARMMEADEVARVGYRGLMAGRSVVIPGARNRLLAALVRWLPRAAVTQAVRILQEHRGDHTAP